ncbi:hypothetical protein HK405_004977, partial [Cladochytrium tenue]
MNPQPDLFGPLHAPPLLPLAVADRDGGDDDGETAGVLGRHVELFQGALLASVDRQVAQIRGQLDE